MKAAPENIELLASRLKEISDSLVAEEPADLSQPRVRRIRKTIDEACEKLRRLVDDLDPVKRPDFMFDPSNPNVAGRIVAVTMVAQPRRPLSTVSRFYGSGVYALYFNGTFPVYAGISGREHPIYVGKADPARPDAKTAIEQGDRLSNRLSDHRRNIAKATTTLQLSDFEYRALVVQTGWQTSAEEYLIHLFKPLWNNEVGICYGFGKHGDDPGTRSNQRSPWDTLHPGRDWAHRDPTMRDAKKADEIVGRIERHISENPPMKSVEEILVTFLDEIRALT